MQQKAVATAQTASTLLVRRIARPGGCYPDPTVSYRSAFTLIKLCEMDYHNQQKKQKNNGRTYSK